MAAMDGINKRYSRGTIKLASEGIDKSWVMRRKFKSPNFTNAWDELSAVK